MRMAARFSYTPKGLNTGVEKKLQGASWDIWWVLLRKMSPLLLFSQVLLPGGLKSFVLMHFRKC